MFRLPSSVVVTLLSSFRLEGLTVVLGCVTDVRDCVQLLKRHEAVTWDRTSIHWRGRAYLAVASDN